MADARDPEVQELRDLLLLRAQGLTQAAREELFEQTRLVFRRLGREDVGPSYLVDAAESNPVFRGLNHSRDLLPKVKAAVDEIAEDPEKAMRDYEKRVAEIRGSNGQKSSNGTTAG